MHSRVHKTDAVGIERTVGARPHQLVHGRHEIRQCVPVAVQHIQPDGIQQPLRGVDRGEPAALPGQPVQIDPRRLQTQDSKHGDTATGAHQGSAGPAQHIRILRLHHRPAGLQIPAVQRRDDSPTHRGQQQQECRSQETSR